MRVVLALLLALAPLLSLAAQQTVADEPTSATWGGLLWILLMVVGTVALVALGVLALRSSTKERE